MYHFHLMKIIFKQTGPLLLWSLMQKKWIDFKAAHWQLSTHGFGKKELKQLSPLPNTPSLLSLSLVRVSCSGLCCSEVRHSHIDTMAGRAWGCNWGCVQTAVAMRGLNLLFVPLTLLVLESQCFELQDTIHALIEENIHLHDQLENLTQALRELKRMLWHHSNGTLV